MNPIPPKIHRKGTSCSQLVFPSAPRLQLHPSLQASQAETPAVWSRGSGHQLQPGGDQLGILPLAEAQLRLQDLGVSFCFFRPTERWDNVARRVRRVLRGVRRERTRSCLLIVFFFAGGLRWSTVIFWGARLKTKQIWESG